MKNFTKRIIFGFIYYCLMCFLVCFITLGMSHKFSKPVLDNELEPTSKEMRDEIIRQLEVKQILFKKFGWQFWFYREIGK